MALATGLPFAALSRMILDRKVGAEHQKGVFSCESWVNTETFYQYMERYGVQKDIIMEPIFEESKC